MTERAIILAAGKGERLVNGFSFPKPLKRVAGIPLVVRVLRNLERAGVEEVGIVVGYKADTLIAGLKRYRFNLDLRFFHNDEYDKPNGTSLVKAADFVTGPTYLMMSDHLWSPDLFEAVARYPLGEREAVLGIDYDVGRCFDLPDATKVGVVGDRLARIGKDLPRFDALDTGVFRITPSLVQALRDADGPQGCSLSQGVAALAAAGRMRVADVGDARWIDVDTPQAHAEAERLVRLHGDALVPSRAVRQAAAAG
ncbi:MAG: NTP transferase domain-containing protein [Myxococcota bacterium]